MIGTAIIFDLDGTLLDTLTDLAETTNAVLAKFDLPSHSIDAYRFLVGDGVRVLMERAIPANRHGDSVGSDNLVDACVEEFHQEYAGRWARQSGPYPGIAELLDSLTERGFPLGVLSNKPQAFTVQCVETLLANWKFSSVLGQRDGISKKPDPIGVTEMLQTWNLPPQQCLYVGDTNTDMQTGRNAGCITIGVTWGFRPRKELEQAGADHIIDQPQQLLDYLPPPS